MKKFMTVLLVIAVMFTFSFGTAFAAPTKADTALMTEAENMALATAEKNLAAAIAELDGYKVGGTYEIDATAWAAIQAEFWKALKADIMAEINEATYDITAGDTAKTFYEREYVSGYAYLTSIAIKAELTTNYWITKVLPYQLDIDAAEIVAELDKVDFEKYSKTTPKTGDTYYEQAIAAVKAAKASVLDEVKTAKTTGTYDALIAEAGRLPYLLPFFTDPILLGTTSIPSGMYILDQVNYASIETIAEEASQDAVDAAKTAELKAQIANNVAVYVRDTAAPNKDFIAAYTTIYNFLAEEVPYALDATGFLAAHYDNMPTHITATFETVIENVEDLVAYAAKYAAETDAAGNVIRDAADVQDIVDDAKLDAYKVIGLGTTATYSIDTAKRDILGMTTEAAAAYLAFKKEAYKLDAEDARATALKSYYPLEQVKVNAKYDEYIAKVDAAKSVDKIPALSTVSLTGIDTKTTVNGYFTSGKLETAFDDYLADNKVDGSLDKYLEYKNAGLSVKDAAFVDAATLETKVVKFFGENGARTAAEMKALAGELTAIVDALPTLGAEAAKKAEVEAAIKALPATVTVADKEVVEAAWKAMEEYIDMLGVSVANDTDVANKATLATKVDKLHSAMALDLAKQSALVDKADKAALKAVAAEIKAFNKLHDADKLFEDYTAQKYEDTTVSDALAAIRAAELKAVDKAINAIPVNVTEAAKAQIVAARALYDAYVAEYTDADSHDYAADDADFRALESAEAVLGLNDKSEEIAKMEAIAAIEGLKIKANSSAKKGSITVKWTVSEEVEGVKYQVYKSTKAQTGYKKAITTSKTSFKNTKNLTKGTRYFYKVRAIGEVDGVTYYSDWSNKANRYAK